MKHEVRFSIRRSGCALHGLNQLQSKIENTANFLNFWYFALLANSTISPWLMEKKIFDDQLLFLLFLETGNDFRLIFVLWNRCADTLRFRIRDSAANILHKTLRTISFRGVFRTESNIYDWAFFAKIVNL